MEIIVDIAAEMLDDEAGGTGGQLACYFFCEVFNRPLPQPFKDDQAALKEVEDELMKEAVQQAAAWKKAESWECQYDERIY